MKFSISPSNKYSGLISFRIDWFDLLAVQRTLKSLLQHNSKASILQHSAFRASLEAQLVKNLLAMRETWVQSLGWEALLEKFCPPQYSGLENSMTVTKELDVTERLSLSAFTMIQVSYPYTTTGKTMALTIQI